MEKLIDFTNYPIANVLDLLLQDKSTKKNIIWATDTYGEFGEGFSDEDEIKVGTLLSSIDLIRPRIQKSQETQSQRTQKKAEVFTPAWICNKMNNYCDDDWFGYSNVFNNENIDHTWKASEEKIEFPKEKSWQHYVDSRRLEITCGEGPYLVSRYDTATGELIVPPLRRIGILDRKLRIVNENTDTYEDWLKWVYRAYEATYGYEYQGDNLLIARANLILTFIDYYQERWKQKPDDNLLQHIANIIVWNIWQMDGLKDTVPLGKPYEQFKQTSLFDIFDDDNDESEKEAIPCLIYNWSNKTSIKFMDLKGTIEMGKKLFDYVIGNPPYNEDFENSGDNGKFAKPVYNFFMDAAYKVADKVELIHPARFLFDAGSTPKAWNKKMLNDEHFKILHYEANSKNVFSNTDIKGGIAISYRDSDKSYGAIGTFTAFNELNSILKKVIYLSANNTFLNTIISGRGVYKLSDLALEEHPEIVEIQSIGHKKDVGAGAFNKLNDIVFFENKPTDGYEYVKYLGLVSNNRCYYWGKKEYLDVPESFYKYKVFIPKANGSGAIGEVLSTPLIGEPLIGEPLIGATETFLSIGSFDTYDEANNCLKYITSKFARVMLGILKITQDNTRDKWRYVPLQDFTPSSDIDWSKSIAEIDRQLYKKYGLDEQEIEFIETHVQEMA